MLGEGWRKEKQHRQGDTPKFANADKVDIKREYKSVSVMDKQSRKQIRADKNQRAAGFIAGLKKQI